MTTKSMKTLNWAAALCIFTGILIMSPAGQLFFYILAVILVAIPLICSIKYGRLVAAALLTIAIFLAVSIYPQFSSHMTKYRNNAEKNKQK